MFPVIIFTILFVSHVRASDKENSLFFPPPEPPSVVTIPEVKYKKKPETPLVLQGILCQGDDWTVWINNTKIESRNSVSIKEWTILAVHSDHIIVMSRNTKKTRTLYVQHEAYVDNEKEGVFPEDKEKEIDIPPTQLENITSMPPKEKPEEFSPASEDNALMPKDMHV